jgi:DNA-nicking Smr family endonuclease
VTKAGGKQSKADKANQGKSGGFNQPFGKLGALKKKLEEEEKANADAMAQAKAKGLAPPPTTRASAHAPPRSKRASGGRAPVQSAEEAAEEALSFHRMMSGVTPIDQTRGRIPKTQSTVERSSVDEIAARRANAESVAESETAAVREHLRTLIEDTARFEISDDGRRVEGRRVDLPLDVLRKLRRGLLPIDAQIDLHGLRGGDARAAVDAFLRDKRERGERCVLLVHGKGDHSPGGVGVLRGEVAAWLSQGAASQHVAAFSTATDSDGGEGALYVLLRPR